MISFSYVVITPVRNEENYLKTLFNSMVHQSISPLKWVIVNDGSTDDTPKLLDSLSISYDWIHIVHRKNRGFRKSGGGVIEAFYDGYELVKNLSWDYIVKLDGDLSFPPNYFENCFLYFSKSPNLGICGGTVYSYINGKKVIDSKNDPPFHVRGATKIYDRRCWKQIGPLIESPGWDTIDEVKANMFGWETKTFETLPIIQHKPTGSADGAFKNYKKNGFANYHTGYHPFFMFGKSMKRMFRKPYFIASLGLIVGFLSGYFKRIPRYVDDKTISYIRKQQIRYLTFKTCIYNSKNRQPSDVKNLFVN